MAPHRLQHRYSHRVDPTRKMIHELLESLEHNPIFSGGLTLMLIGSAAALLRKFPAQRLNRRELTGSRERVAGACCQRTASVSVSPREGSEIHSDCRRHLVKRTGHGVLA
jgi:hypothetical protein